MAESASSEGRSAHPGLVVANVLFDDRFGGPQKRVIEVATALRLAGIWTVMVLPRGSGDAQARAEEAGMEVVRVPAGRIPNPRNVLGVIRWGIRFPWEVYCYLRSFRALKPNVVHVNGAAFLPPVLAARILRLPLLWHLNDTIVPRRIAGVFGALVRLLADQIAVAAVAVGRHYGLSRGKYAVLYAPVDTNVFATIPDRPARRGNQLETSVTLIANWNPNKGVDVFLQACAEVIRKGVRLRINLAGKRLDTHADYARRIEELIGELELSSHIAHTGFVERVDLILEKTDVVVLSSYSEACPLAVLEAMAAGRPVVSTDVGGVRELLFENGSNAAGVVVPPGDFRGIGEAILRIAGNPDLGLQMGRIGRRRAEAHFSLDRCAAEHSRLYAALMQVK